MAVVVVSVVIALVLAVVVAGIVVVGMRGDLPEVSERAPELAGRFEWAARHLNGEAAPSQRLADLELAVATRFRGHDGRGADESSSAGDTEQSAYGHRSVPSPRLSATGDFGHS